MPQRTHSGCKRGDMKKIKCTQCCLCIPAKEFHHCLLHDLEIFNPERAGCKEGIKNDKKREKEAEEEEG